MRTCIPLLLVLNFCGFVFAQSPVVTPPANVSVNAGKIVSDLVPKMVFVQGGTFQMGCDEKNDGQCNPKEQPVHAVTLTDFNIGTFEITVEQFKQFIDASGYKTDAEKEGFSYVWTSKNPMKKNAVNWRCDAEGMIRPITFSESYPVVHVSWNDARA